MNRAYIRPVHIIMEIASYALMVVALIISIIFATRIDGKIPTHFDFYGNPSGYGSPWVLIIFPAIMIITGLIISLTIHKLNPKHWNMPVKVTEKNALIVYGHTVSMICAFLLEMAIYTLYFSIRMGLQNPGSMVSAIILVVVIFATMAYFIYKTIQDGKKYM